MKTVHYLFYGLVICALIPSLGNRSLTSFGAAPTKTESHATLDRSYVLGPGDAVVIRSIDSEEISDKPVEIGLDGFISLPLVGRLQAGGLTAEALERSLVEKLKPYIRRPQVSVGITQFGSQPVSILGSVSAPGVYQLQGPKRLTDLLAMAKGLMPDAGGTIRITRRASFGDIPLRPVRDDSEGYRTAEVSVAAVLGGGDASQNIRILPHDVISVPRAKLVYVLGEVRKPGGFVLNARENISVLEALSMAEGTQRTAASHRARLLRVVADSPQRKEVAINLKNILAGKEPNLMMEADDILLVPNNVAKSAALRGVEAAIQMGTGIAIFRQSR